VTAFALLRQIKKSEHMRDGSDYYGTGYASVPYWTIQCLTGRRRADRALQAVGDRLAPLRQPKSLEATVIAHSEGVRSTVSIVGVFAVPVF
jgi:hypothetical protein